MKDNDINDIINLKGINKNLISIIKIIIKYQIEFNEEKMSLTDFNSNDKNKYEINENILQDFTNLKLQKVLYFLYGYYTGIAKHEPNIKVKKLWETDSNIDFEAWPYGPVIKNVYDNFDIIEKYIDEIKETEENDIKTDLDKNFKDWNNNNNLLYRKTIKKILEYLANFSVWNLVRLSHKTDPWKKANEISSGAKIKIEEIENFFIDNYEVYKNKFQ